MRYDAILETCVIAYILRQLKRVVKVHFFENDMIKIFVNGNCKSMQSVYINWAFGSLLKVKIREKFYYFMQKYCKSSNLQDIIWYLQLGFTIKDIFSVIRWARLSVCRFLGRISER